MKTQWKSLGETVLPSPFALFVRLLVFSTALLVFVGATITTTGSGLAVPDWPLSFGQVNPAMVGGVFYEHGHRLVASAVGFLVLVAALWASFIRAHKTVRRLALAALALVIFQGLLGGLTVLMRLPTAVSVAHGTVAQLFFCTVVAMLWWTNSSFVEAKPSIEGGAAYNLKVASIGMTCLVLLQLLIGAVMRHMGAGLVIPDFPTSLGRVIPPLNSAAIAINFSHRIMAVAVTAMAVLLFLRIYRFHRSSQALVRLGYSLIGLVAVQLTLGAFAVWSARGLVPTSLHVTNGALVLAASFSIMMWTFRLTRRESQDISVAEHLNAHTQAQAVSAVAQPEEAHAPAFELLEDRATSYRQVSRKDWMELAKVRLVSMSVFTALCGFLLGGSDFSWAGFWVAVLGVSLLGSGSAMLNHVVEIETDSQMERTRNRPLPAGRVDIAVAERTGGVLVAAGTLILGLWQPIAGLLAFAAFFSYVFMYTPMKRFSASCTVVGAVPGALPVLIGYVVGTGRLDLGGMVLFTILFLWQLPHFMAIAWLCKDDYERAGLPMVTVIDPAGNLASAQVLIYCLALLPVSLAPTLIGMAGSLYFYCALALGLVYLYSGAQLCRQRTVVRARKLLLTSVVYLPLLYGVMVVNS